MTAAVAPSKPPANGRKSVATVFGGRDPAELWATATRRCKRCAASFQPIRREQEFCPGGECRRAWWREHAGDQPHKCRCGEVHCATQPLWVQAPAAWGTMLLSYVASVGVRLPPAIAAAFLSDDTPISVLPAGMCPRPNCGGALAEDWDNEPRCLLCGRSPERPRKALKRAKVGRLVRGRNGRRRRVEDG